MTGGVFVSPGQSARPDRAFAAQSSDVVIAVERNPELRTRKLLKILTLKTLKPNKWDRSRSKVVQNSLSLIVAEHRDQNLNRRQAYCRDRQPQDRLRQAVRFLYELGTDFIQ